MNHRDEQPERRPPSEDSLTVTRELPSTVGRFKVLGELGAGGFGIVYKAHDPELSRMVAVKIPHRERIARPEDVEAYLAEARILASLDHPHIVPVYDVGRTEDGLCYVVSKFIEGASLASIINRGRPSPAESVELVATVAEALHYAHRTGLVHRDIKPANILIDESGRPCVVDFGMAIKEEDYGKGARHAGTPGYMSPEQARGEGHRVDGRSDIFSLGVVFYELLTGHRPFRGETPIEVQMQIIERDPRPPRMWDDSISKELERICLKALSKRAADRYLTARDFADDLRLFATETLGNEGPSVVRERVQPSLAQNTPEVVIAPTPPSPAGETPLDTPASATPPTPASDRRPIRIIPKGLRSFDAHDADFFLELVPGPRDRNGLPESIRFWKTRIESGDADTTFSVGLLYGPSGCGKSSLVKAGLLPRLARHVIAVYVEATATDTESRLRKSLNKVCPLLESTAAAPKSLPELLAAIRRGGSLPHGQKVLIVLDQFEQWLHAHADQERNELVEALRQCDGERVQCLLLVRDDFWMAATRFMRELEVPLLEGQNSAAADLFNPRHARKVLAAFGRAFGALEEESEPTADQQSFLEQAVAGLAQDGKVVSVRLALFAEMMKGRPWTPESLKAVGGAEGVGVTFLEETFSATTAPPQHRYHQQAARAVLQSLLPQQGTDIKGHLRSRDELCTASGYPNRPREFDELLHLLDGELLLITPAEGSRVEGRESSAGDDRYYQLTHDYLVPSLRDWLTRKQRETRRGQAELSLAERAAGWTKSRESRHLPNLLEFLNIRWFTSKRTWSSSQQQMMRAALAHHSLRSGVVTLFGAMLVLLLAIGGPLVAVREANLRAGILDQKREADRQKTNVEKQKKLAERHSYVAHMNLAQNNWDAARMRAVRDLLDLHIPHQGQEELRGFEWYYLDRLCDSNLPTLKGHTHEVTCVAFSPDGKWLASASGDKTVKVWDATSGQETLTLKGHISWVHSVAFSPNGKRLASASQDQLVKVWDITSGLETRTLEGHTGGVNSVAFSPDGKRLASASQDQTVKVWDGTSGQETFTLQGHTGWINSVAFSPDRKWLASASQDQTVKLWDATSGLEAFTLQGHTGWVNSVAFSPDGKWLASASQDQTVKVWHTTSGQETFTLEGYNSWVHSVAFSTDGQQIASASQDRRVRVWDTMNGQATRTLEGHTGGVKGVAFSPDGKRLASASQDQTVKMWLVTSGQKIFKLEGHTGGVKGVAFSPDGKRLASGSADKTVKVWDATSGQEMLTLKGHSGEVHSVAYSADGKVLASASADKTVKVWDVTTGQVTLTLKGHSRDVHSVAFSADGKRLASASFDHTVKVWDATSGQETLTLKRHTDWVSSVAFSADGKRLASVSWNEPVKVWDTTSGQDLLTLNGHTDRVNSIAFSPDGKWLASASDDTVVKLWDTTSSQETLTLKGHTGRVMSVAFSPDGKRLASASSDHTVKVWDTTSGQETLTLKGPFGKVINSVAFSADGKRLASANYDDQTVNVWDTRPLINEFRDDNER